MEAVPSPSFPPLWPGRTLIGAPSLGLGPETERSAPIPGWADPGCQLHPPTKLSSACHRSKFQLPPPSTSPRGVYPGPCRLPAIHDVTLRQFNLCPFLQSRFPRVVRHSNLREPLLPQFADFEKPFLEDCVSPHRQGSKTTDAGGATRFILHDSCFIIELTPFVFDDPSRFFAQSAIVTIRIWFWAGCPCTQGGRFCPA